MDTALARQIASHYLPSRWHYHYSRSKLSIDPLYDGVCSALGNTRAAVLDLGCGIGLLAHCLRTRRLTMPYLGVDNDAGKVRLAQRATSALEQVRFAVTDLASAFPAHLGSVVILDVMQYLSPVAQQQLLQRACECIAQDGMLVIRTCLTDNSWRSKVTWAADMVGRAVRWMNASPKAYPSREQMNAIFAAHGLVPRYQSLAGNTPFNNWLVTAAPPAVTAVTAA